MLNWKPIFQRSPRSPSSGWTSTLMKETEISETLVSSSTLTWLIAQEHFSTFIHCESFRSYIWISMFLEVLTFHCAEVFKMQYTLTFVSCCQHSKQETDMFQGQRPQAAHKFLLKYHWSSNSPRKGITVGVMKFVMVKMVITSLFMWRHVSSSILVNTD
jgi:hypothetical protein